MGSAWLLFCPTTLLLVSLSSAQEMQHPDSFMLQREADLTELLDLTDFPVEQVMVPPPGHGTRERGGFRPGALTPRGRRPGFSPRSFGGPPILEYPVQFPLGRPTSENLEAICLHGDHRPRYPDSYFPDSGFGQQRRRASAVNTAEAWFGTCCKGNQTWEKEVTLCCATQAWERSVDLFCQEDSSVKDRLYDCCRLSGQDRLSCFNNDAPKPNYDATELLPVQPLPSTANFTFDPSTCERTPVTQYRARANRAKQQKKPLTSMKVDMNFPLGRPTAETVKSMCRSQKLRPFYNIRCLPAEGYELVARQARAINHLENGFKKCCKKKKGLLSCADQKWREELDKFCRSKNGEQVDFSCCSHEKGQDRYNCFQAISQDPFYNLTSVAEEITLTKLCTTHKIIKKRFPVGIPLKTFVKKCCPLPEEEKTTCFMQKVVDTSKNLCSVKKPLPAVRRCCAVPSHETPHCISTILKDAVTKAADVLRQKMRKRCPLS
ncbi:extracellular matrix protein 1 isoform X2 [Salarias fasciatus]|uniref:Extracellular matrix protein 1-like n=1 Tax=Salarias fasciatus TaxID=181472 RepID=A0A672J4L1_SALFA|nr:extracellular matrix protein 1-like isoform X2 [Salarias fasciatus]